MEVLETAFNLLDFPLGMLDTRKFQKHNDTCEIAGEAVTQGSSTGQLASKLKQSKLRAEATQLRAG